MCRHTGYKAEPRKKEMCSGKKIVFLLFSVNGCSKWLNSSWKLKTLIFSYVVILNIIMFFEEVVGEIFCLLHKDTVSMDSLAFSVFVFCKLFNPLLSPNASSRADWTVNTNTWRSLPVVPIAGSLCQKYLIKTWQYSSCNHHWYVGNIFHFIIKKRVLTNIFWSTA